MEEELKLIIKHSKVLASTDLEELKDSDDVVQDFNGISLKEILQGNVTFEPFDKLINTLNIFFKYDVDLYLQLLDFLVKNYVIKLRHNDITLKNAIYPVMVDIKNALGNDNLYDYIFKGDVSNLSPLDIFLSVELLSSSTQHFKEEAFTSKVVAEGLSRFTGNYAEMFNHLKHYPFVVVYEDMIEAAIKKDNVVLLDYLITKHKDQKDIDKLFFICQYAAKGGNLECLKYTHKNGGFSNWDEETCSGAAKNGHLDCLIYLHENKCPWDENTCDDAAKNGHLDCLKYAHENKCPWDEWTCQGAAKNGHLNCLKYVHENGCPWDEDTCHGAARYCHLDCLKYARDNGCPE